MGEGNEQKVSGKKIRSHGAGLAMRVSCVSIAINVVLSVFKVGAGYPGPFRRHDIGWGPFCLGCVQHADCHGRNYHGFQKVR